MDLDFQIETINSCHNVNFEWTITNFSKLANSVESSPFSPIAGGSSKWVIQLEFNPVTGVNYMYVKIKSLDKVDSSPTMRVTGSISLKNKTNNVWKENPINQIITANQCVNCFRMPNTEPKVTLPSSIRNYFSLPDDTIIVRCCLSISGDITSVITKAELPYAEDVAINTMNVIYEKRVFTDLTFQFENGELKVHKVILSARSPVFEKMFQHNTLEQKNNTVRIKDFELTVFDNFIAYLYTGKIKEYPKMDLEMLLSLYELGDKYEVLEFRKYCANILVSEFLNVNTVFQILKTADAHGDDSLKSKAMELFRHKFSECIKIEEWKTFSKGNVMLAAEIVSFVTSLSNSRESK